MCSLTSAGWVASKFAFKLSDEAHFDSKCCSRSGSRLQLSILDVDRCSAWAHIIKGQGIDAGSGLSGDGAHSASGSGYSLALFRRMFCTTPTVFGPELTTPVEVDGIPKVCSGLALPGCELCPSLQHIYASISKVSATAAPVWIIGCSQLLGSFGGRANLGVILDPS